MDLQLYVGTYTTDGGEGIYHYALDGATGALRLLNVTPAAEPSYLTLSSDGRHLYAVNELAEGMVSAYAVEGETGRLTLLNTQPSKGAHPCYISLAAGYALVANYTGGTVTVLPILPDGRLGAPRHTVAHVGSGPNARRQEKAHPHSVVAAGETVLVPDLGMDQIAVYRLSGGRLERVSALAAAPGAGPRHLAFGPAVTYVVNELDSTVAVYAGETLVQVVPTLPPGVVDAGNTGADIHLHPSGQFLYASNRGHDSVACFRVEPDGLLALAAHTATGGRIPRNFAIDPTGTWLLAANQGSGSIVTFLIDRETGALAATGHVTEVGKPVCIQVVAP